MGSKDRLQGLVPQEIRTVDGKKGKNVSKQGIERDLLLPEEAPHKPSFLFRMHSQYKQLPSTDVTPNRIKDAIDRSHLL